ncbi:DUF2817 domain-containing protein [Rubinisphaera margarita]|uniref:DUF2817 domain-containing protein n=1 Tax=Rubinisphaera margarita TaxID=2909586 RepID=UPI001EE7A9E6|nr:DUF2817 domain-containing protein [Rubinisphaera margarita]MCG6154474.1 M14 family metallopeptidase [Rubinisphaera margarita]
MTGAGSEDWFSRSYDEARGRILQMAGQVGCSATAIAHPTQTPEQPLALDVIRCGNEDAPLQLVLSSGLHGVESPSGSAAQLAFLERLHRTSLPETVQVTILHALNPWGWGHGRRMDDRNVDGNRNFLLPGEHYEGAPETYRKIDRLLNPEQSGKWPGQFFLTAAGLVLRYGYGNIKKAIATGQYEFERGLFFGGHEPNWTTAQLQSLIPELTRTTRRVCHLDFHTGIGEYGRGQLFVDHPLSSCTRDWMAETYPANTLNSLPTESEPPYRARGSFSKWFYEKSTAAETLSCCAEFGTLSSLKMLNILIRENTAYHYDGIDSARRKELRTELEAAFCPKDPVWRRAVLEQSEQLIWRAIDRLSAWG